jgi:AraC-like DNA-binding protein
MIHGQIARFHARSSTFRRVDALAGLLDGPRARDAFLLRTVMSPPWCVRVVDEAPLSLIAVVSGSAWVVPDDGEGVHVVAGDVVVTRGPHPFTFADDPATPPQAIIHPGPRCTTPDGVELKQAMELGVRAWGNDPAGTDVQLVGTYHLDGEVGARLLAALPTLLVVPAGSLDAPLVELLADEMARDDPGQDAVLDRLLDLLLITTLRAWFARQDEAAPRWYRANRDPLVGRALRVLYNNPAHPWTVASLASEVGASRAALARRFTELVGEPPMTFLTDWRMSLAADLLLVPGATIGAVARQVGYASPYALSNAFKRTRGVSPRQHRLRAST